MREGLFYINNLFAMHTTYSGTLSPLDSVSSELGLEFRETLENPHVINKHQVGCVDLMKNHHQIYTFVVVTTIQV